MDGRVRGSAMLAVETAARPVALRRLGLDSGTLTSRYPRLVYARGHGFGVRGPDADMPGYDSSALGRAAGWATSLRRRTRTSRSASAARWATATARCRSPSGSPPRCCAGSAPAAGRSSTYRCSPRRCGRCPPTCWPPCRAASRGPPAGGTSRRTRWSVRSSGRSARTACSTGCRACPGADRRAATAHAARSRARRAHRGRAARARLRVGRDHRPQGRRGAAVSSLRVPVRDESSAVYWGGSRPARAGHRPLLAVRVRRWPLILQSIVTVRAGCRGPAPGTVQTLARPRADAWRAFVS